MNEQNCETARYQPVIQPWACRLSLRMQSTMLLSMRGPDGCSKHNTAKMLLRQLRSAVIVPAFPGRPDSFMGDQSGICDGQVVEAFLDDHDAYPHHWLMHFIHAAEIVGQFHPDDGVRGFWWGVYVALCNTFHMRNEGIEELSERLADPILSPAAGRVTNPGPRCVACGVAATREFCYAAEPWVPYCATCQPQYETAGVRTLKAAIARAEGHV